MRGGSGWKRTEPGILVPTETLKLTLVVSWIFSERMAETIWVRFSAGGAAVADVAALPVVLDLLSRALSLAAVLSLVVLSLVVPSRDCAFLPLSLLMPSLDWASFVLSLLEPSRDCAFLLLSLLMPSLDWALFMPPLLPSPDSAPFMPDDPPDSRFIGAAEGAPRSDGWADG